MYHQTTYNKLKSIGIICRARKVLHKNTLVTLYYTFIYPYLNYCCTVWGTAAATYLSRLVILQKKIVRIISGKPRLFPTLGLFHNLGILRIDLLSKFKLSIFCFKYLNNELPGVFNGFVTPVSDIHEYYTRSSPLLYIHTPRTVYAENSVKFQAPLAWNSLNSQLRQIPFIASFKRSLKLHLINSLTDV